MDNIRLEKGNVVRIVDSQEKAEALKAKGFKEVEAPVKGKAAAKKKDDGEDDGKSTGANSGGGKKQS